MKGGLGDTEDGLRPDRWGEQPGYLAGSRRGRGENSLASLLGRVDDGGGRRGRSPASLLGYEDDGLWPDEAPRPGMGIAARLPCGVRIEDVERVARLPRWVRVDDIEDEEDFWLGMAWVQMRGVAVT